MELTGKETEKITMNFLQYYGVMPGVGIINPEAIPTTAGTQEIACGINTPLPGTDAL